MKVSDLKKKTLPFEVTLEGDFVITGTFRPSSLTTAMLERLVGLSQKDGEPEFAPTVLAESLGELLVTWDLTEDDETPIEPTAETVKAYLPPSYQRTIYDALAERMRPNRTSGATSAAG